MLKRIRILATTSVALVVISTNASAQKRGAASAPPATTGPVPEAVVAAAPPPAAVDSSQLAADAAAPQLKKGGMFGKMKGLAHNKMAQGIVKGAVCAAVPGGSQIMGAINAKQAKSAAGVAGNAAAAAGTAVAGAAAGAAAGAISGGGCLPGMGAIAGLANGKLMTSGMAPMPGRGGVGGAAVSGLAGAAQTAAMQKAMGGRGASAPSTGATTVASAGSVQTLNAQMQSVAAANADAGGAAAPLATDAPGQQMEIPGDMKAALSKGKLVLKNVDWVQHANLPSASTQQMLSDVMKSVGGALQQSGAKWRVDVYVGKDYQDAEAKTLAAARATTVIGLLVSGGAPAEMVAAGKAERDKEPRIEIVKVK